MLTAREDCSCRCRSTFFSGWQARSKSEKHAMTKLCTTGQVARICKVSARTVNKWFDSGRLRGYRTGASQIRQIPRANLLQFLQEHNMPLGELHADLAPARRRAAHHRRRALLHSSGIMPRP